MYRFCDQEGGNLEEDPRNWSQKQRLAIEDFNDDDEDGDDVAEEDENRSLDLLVKFVQNVFNKISRKGRRAVRPVLPVAISTKLVVFTLGSIVFVSILLICGIWSGVLYLQQSHNHRANEFDDEPHAWTGAQPAS